MNDKKKIVALVPVKANSERIPNKNFKNFLGQPLYKWILNTLLSLQEISTVIINTDAREVFKKYGFLESDRIIIHERRDSLCGDFVSMNKIIEDDLNRFSADIYIMTHTTNPILRPDTIKKALHEFQKNCIDGEFDSLFTVNRYQTRFYRGDGSPVNHDPENLIRTQDLESWYEENSNLYIFSKKSFMEKRARIGKKPFLFEMPRWESIDIDDQDSWDLAEMVARSKG